jgi:hypothetical protein
MVTTVDVTAVPWDGDKIEIAGLMVSGVTTDTTVDFIATPPRPSSVDRVTVYAPAVAYAWTALIVPPPATITPEAVVPSPKSQEKARGSISASEAAAVKLISWKGATEADGEMISVSDGGVLSDAATLARKASRPPAFAWPGKAPLVQPAT